MLAGRQPVKVAEVQLASGMMTLLLLQLLVVVNGGAQLPLLHIQTHTHTQSLGVFIHSFIHPSSRRSYIRGR